MEEQQIKELKRRTGGDARHHGVQRGALHSKGRSPSSSTLGHALGTSSRVGKFRQTFDWRPLGRRARAAAATSRMFSRIAHQRSGTRRRVDVRSDRLFDDRPFHLHGRRQLTAVHRERSSQALCAFGPSGLEISRATCCTSRAPQRRRRPTAVKFVVRLLCGDEACSC